MDIQQRFSANIFVKTVAASVNAALHQHFLPASDNVFRRNSRP